MHRCNAGIGIAKCRIDQLYTLPSLPILSPFVSAIRTSSSFRLSRASAPIHPSFGSYLSSLNSSFHRFFISRKKKKNGERIVRIGKEYDDSSGGLTDCFSQDLWCLHLPQEESGRNVRAEYVRVDSRRWTDLQYQETKVFAGCLRLKITLTFLDYFAPESRHNSFIIYRISWTQVTLILTLNFIINAVWKKFNIKIWRVLNIKKYKEIVQLFN